MPHPILRRAAGSVVVILGVVTLTFVLLHAAPGDPVALLLGPTASPAQLETQRHVMGFDRPLAAQYGAWLARFVQGEWGTSIATGRPVAAMIAGAWPATLWLVGLSLLFSYVLGIAIGTVQAAAGRGLDTALSVGSVTFFAMPGYWLGLILVLVFTYQLRWLPAFGISGFDADYLTPFQRLVDRLRHLALPLLTLTLIGIGGVARYVRGAMLEVRAAPFVTSARAKGVGPKAVMRRHVLRNALIPVVVLLGLSLPALFSGAVFVEGIFAWPGVGRILVEAVQARDYPVVMAATAVSATLVVLGNLLAELLLAVVDPRVRHQGPRTGAS